jgi:hypothetical protein
MYTSTAKQLETNISTQILSSFPTKTRTPSHNTPFMPNESVPVPEAQEAHHWDDQGDQSGAGRRWGHQGLIRSAKNTESTSSSLVTYRDQWDAGVRWGSQGLLWISADEEMKER